MPNSNAVSNFRITLIITETAISNKHTHDRTDRLTIYTDSSGIDIATGHREWMSETIKCVASNEALLAGCSWEPSRGAVKTTKSISEMTAITGFQGTQKSLVFLRSVSPCVLWIYYLSHYLLEVNPHFVLELKRYQIYFASECVQMKFPVTLLGRRVLFLPCLYSTLCFPQCTPFT